jgi:methanol--5-hydroxybenzimidazolylcobamide Co-methyltransferase
MKISEQTWPDIRKNYENIITAVCQRALELHCPGLVVEFELLPPMTLNPEWGAEITETLNSVLENFYHKQSLATALRVTPVDVRENERPPKMRQGKNFEKTLKSFELCAQAGADMLSIESTGGKELHDDALVNADLANIIFALGVLAVNDMQFLWEKIVGISKKYNVIPAGDTACGFANTAMVLADKGLIPKTLAAVIRVASVARTLQAHLQGAQGPSKDCAYEGPYIKALTGVPISMEGKSSACAHLSSLGNIAAVSCDLWSNESVQIVRLLSASAPVVSMEQLIYDCRLMNEAVSEGRDAALFLQRLLTASDVRYDPQAYVLHPQVVETISEKLAQQEDPLAMVFCAVDETIKVLKDAVNQKLLILSDTEKHWLNLISLQRETIPTNKSALYEYILSFSPELKFIPQEYGL